MFCLYCKVQPPPPFQCLDTLSSTAHLGPNPSKTLARKNTRQLLSYPGVIKEVTGLLPSWSRSGGWAYRFVWLRSCSWSWRCQSRWPLARPGRGTAPRWTRSQWLSAGGCPPPSLCSRRPRPWTCGGHTHRFQMNRVTNCDSASSGVIMLQHPWETNSKIEMIKAKTCLWIKKRAAAVQLPSVATAPLNQNQSSRRCLFLSRLTKANSSSFMHGSAPSTTNRSISKDYQNVKNLRAEMINCLF